MLAPNLKKLRRNQKGNKGFIRKFSLSNNVLDKGDFGLRVLKPGRITAAQIESVRKTMSKTVKKTGLLFIRIFPDKSFTKKPTEVRMGGGKGPHEKWIVIVRPGQIIFEVSGVTEEQARILFKMAAIKLPVRTTFTGGELNYE